MFRIPRVNVIESDEGFSVEVLGRTGLLYTEGSKTLHIDSEVMVDPVGIALFKKSIHAWDPPHDNESIDYVRRDIIIENILRAFNSQGDQLFIL
jgi:hypothetical protein